MALYSVGNDATQVAAVASRVASNTSPGSSGKAVSGQVKVVPAAVAARRRSEDALVLIMHIIRTMLTYMYTRDFAANSIR